MASKDYMPEKSMLREIILRAHCILLHIRERLTQPIKCSKIKARLMTQTYIKSCTQMIHNESQPTPRVLAGMKKSWS